MRCPIDGTELVMSERQGVEIDYCPKCRGVWLDRGELDKIIERSAPRSAPSRPAPGKYHGGYSDSGYKGHKKKKKLSGLFDDLFDF
ncbi:MAG: zf-TFIIB domain-containing protein [Mangrovicoccus sp.]